MNQVHIDTRFDVKSLSVASKDTPDLVFVDNSVPRYDDKLKTLDGKPADLFKYLAIHEINERTAMAKGVPYLKAHEEYATPAERAAVIKDCGPEGWIKYSEIMDGYLKKAEHKKILKPPPNPHVSPALAVKE
jgi:hypothetical protein